MRSIFGIIPTQIDFYERLYFGPSMTLNAKIGFLMDFWRFLIAIHISRVNCAEIN